ncbi:hypothetical protein Taro_047447 [Colocasia esculenta]|uniref:Uncharacterized protein n=1 Tax=Colocasia esculenta TaxID=4460 RepID=A0A843X751_COLES|nr:hypothetical protein [Colocasia esculenta]
MLVSSSACSWCTSQNKLPAPSAAPPPFSFAASPASISIFTRRASTVGLCLPRCRAAKQQEQQREGSVKKRAGGRRRSSEKPASREPLVEVLPNPKPSNVPVRQNHPSPLPKPPAGFVVDPHGKVLLVSSKRIATVVDSTSNLPLECVIRRVFHSSQGQECMLLCPVDTPVQILKSTNFTGWSAVNDEEIEAIIPSAAYALAKIHMHLVFSGFCYTARGGFCYSEDDIIEFRTDDGEDIDGLPAEGIEITCFHQVTGPGWIEKESALAGWGWTSQTALDGEVTRLEAGRSRHQPERLWWGVHSLMQGRPVLVGRHWVGGAVPISTAPGKQQHCRAGRG